MSNIVKLILVCQIKDVYIPQLIPLSWVLSNFTLLLIFFTISVIYRISYLGFNQSLLNVVKTDSLVWYW